MTAGPKAGAEFALDPGETTIGRQSGNTIVIADISVSRRHILIRREGVACTLVDQGSGNGTLLNGSRVAAETKLKDGDRIEIGDTELTFRAARVPRAATKATARTAAVPSARQPAAQPSQPRALARRAAPEDPGTLDIPFDRHASKKASRKRLLIIAGVAAIVFILLGALKVRQNTISAERAKDEKRLEYEQALQALDEMIEPAKKAAAAGDFRQSASLLKKALKRAKEQETNDQAWNSRISECQRRLDLSKRELPNQERLEAAKELGEKGELAAAVEKLKTISEDSLLQDKVGKVLEGFKPQISGRIAAGRQALSNKAFDEARQAVTDVLAVDPSNAEAMALTEAIRKAGQKAPAAAPSPPKPGEDATSKILDVFRAGQLDEAIAMAGACSDAKCSELKDKLSAFKDVYQNLQGEGNVGKALQILKTIPSGTSSTYMMKIGAMGASTLVKEGLKAMSGSNYPKAFAAFRQVIAVDPNNEAAKQNLEVIRRKAKELSEQAYVDMQQGEIEKARHELELLVQITESGDELNTKAKARLQKLKGD